MGESCLTGRGERKSQRKRELKIQKGRENSEGKPGRKQKKGLPETFSSPVEEERGGPKSGERKGHRIAQNRRRGQAAFGFYAVGLSAEGNKPKGGEGKGKYEAETSYWKVLSGAVGGIDANREGKEKGQFYSRKRTGLLLNLCHG